MMWRRQRPRPTAVLVCLVTLCVASGTEATVNRGRRGQPVVRARAAVVMDARTGVLIYKKRADERLPPASTTKVVTATLALESGRLDETVTVSQSATLVQPTKLNLRVGDRVCLRDLTRAVLLRSANDASIVVAEALAGSVEDFAARMNRRAAELGARNTSFVNPNGLPAQGHYSTARDLALIFRHALEIPGFREIAGTRESQITARRPGSWRTIHLRNSNRLLSGYRVPVLGKTGYTRAAKRCFVGAARADGREIVVALLGSTDLWGDARRLLDFGFAHSAPAVPGAAATTATTNGGGAGKPSAGPAIAPMISRLQAPAAERPSQPEEYSLILTPMHNSRGAAERLQHFINNRGHSAVVEGVGRPSTRRYLVRVVGFHTLEAARRVGEQLEAEHLRPTIVPPG
jgi:D-alanyl-D-alanine carboxypeptidase